ncbi:MAG: hypothetical protein WBO67_15335, partial [Nitrospira sp.]
QQTAQPSPSQQGSQTLLPAINSAPNPCLKGAPRSTDKEKGGKDGSVAIAAQLRLASIGNIVCLLPYSYSGQGSGDDST